MSDRGDLRIIELPNGNAVRADYIKMISAVDREATPVGDLPPLVRIDIGNGGVEMCRFESIEDAEACRDDLVKQWRASDATCRSI